MLHWYNDQDGNLEKSLTQGTNNNTSIVPHLNSDIGSRMSHLLHYFPLLIVNSWHSVQKVTQQTQGVQQPVLAESNKTNYCYVSDHAKLNQDCNVRANRQNTASSQGGCHSYTCCFHTLTFRKQRMLSIMNVDGGLQLYQHANLHCSGLLIVLHDVNGSTPVEDPL